MKRVEDIRTRRAERFHEMRMSGKEETSRGSDKRELEQQIHLIRAPTSVVPEKRIVQAGKMALTVSVSHTNNAEVFE
jgi:hypothetical protein